MKSPLSPVRERGVVRRWPTMTATIYPDVTTSDTFWRHLPDAPCGVCQGHDRFHRGRKIRCSGYTGNRFIWCSREEWAGDLLPDGATNSPIPVYRHYRFGKCPCGRCHENDGTTPG